MCCEDPWLDFALCLALIVSEKCLNEFHSSQLRPSYIFTCRNLLSFLFDIIAWIVAGVKYGVNFQNTDKTGVNSAVVGSFVVYLIIWCVAIVLNIVVARHFRSKDKEDVCGSRRIRVVTIMSKIVGIASSIALLGVTIPYSAVLEKITTTSTQSIQSTISTLSSTRSTTTSDYREISALGPVAFELYLLTYACFNLLFDFAEILYNLSMIIIKCVSHEKHACFCK